MLGIVPNGVTSCDANEIETRAASALQGLVEIATLPGRAGVNALRGLLL